MQQPAISQVRKFEAHLKTLSADPRHFQMLFQSIFLAFGILFLHWTIAFSVLFIIFSTALICQAAGIYFTTKDYSGLKSATISGLSLALMLKANHLEIYALAAGLSIFSKYLIRYRGRHIYNPTNFGIIICILLTGDAWLSPGQWGSGILILFLIGFAAMSVLFQVSRMDVALSFLISFSGLHFFKMVIYQGWSFDVFLHHISSGTLLLFTFFMITDPITSPKSRKGRIIWASLIGLLAFALNDWFYVHTAPIWALFILTPLSVVLNRRFGGAMFKWSLK